ncbi:MAG: DUF3368 domain-containing protein [Coleofasciculaceae cyanobacterium]
MIVISDTSAINNLAAIGKLDLLQQLYGKIIIPTAVYQELLNAGATDPGTLAVQTLDWIQTKSVTNFALLQTLQNNLDIGEAEAIVLAVELNATRLIIDERRGRNQATQLGVQVIGLLGILLAAKQQGFIPTVQPVLDDLMEQGFWIREQLYAEILQLAGE